MLHSDPIGLNDCRIQVSDAQISITLYDHTASAELPTIGPINSLILLPEGAPSIVFASIPQTCDCFCQFCPFSIRCVNESQMKSEIFCLQCAVVVRFKSFQTIGSESSKCAASLSSFEKSQKIICGIYRKKNCFRN